MAQDVLIRDGVWYTHRHRHTKLCCVEQNRTEQNMYYIVRYYLILYYLLQLTSLYPTSSICRVLPPTVQRSGPIQALILNMWVQEQQRLPIYWALPFSRTIQRYPMYLVRTNARAITFTPTWTNTLTLADTLSMDRHPLSSPLPFLSHPFFLFLPPSFPLSLSFLSLPLSLCCSLSLSVGLCLSLSLALCHSLSLIYIFFFYLTKDSSTLWVS